MAVSVKSKNQPRNMCIEGRQLQAYRLGLMIVSEN
jgi:hypothetical protein